MNIRKIITGAVCLFLAFNAAAQDKIYKKNGEVIDGKISLINGDVIVFKRFDNPDGPEYSIPKADVARIKYLNGSQDIFEENNDRIGVEKGKENKHMYNEYARNKNIVGFAPILFTEHGYGISLNWEQSLDKAGWVTVNVPAMLTWNFASPGEQKDALVYLMPGIKVYPTLNSSMKNKFSIGPSLVFAMGQGSPTNYSYNTDPTPHQNHMMMGAMAVIGANMFPTRQTYLGMDFGLGYSYINRYDNVDNSTSVLMELSLKFGFRYEGKLKKQAAKAAQNQNR